ncbi:MAG: transcription termination factor NusA, partial [Actinomycetota bacterium]
IDVVPWSDNPGELVANALQPAKVKEVRTDPDTQTAQVIVPDYQLSLAIGKEGQNARLAARLTGWRIDIKSETQATAPPEPPVAAAAPAPALETAEAAQEGAEATPEAAELAPDGEAAVEVVPDAPALEEGADEEATVTEAPAEG